MAEEGKAADIVVDAFGDESISQDMVTYGLVIVPSERVAAVTEFLAAIKRELGVPPSTRIHCREMFHADARRKTAWHEFTDDDVFRLLGIVARSVLMLGATCHVAILDRARTPAALDEEDGIPGMPLGDKQLVSFAYFGAVLHLDLEYGFHRVRLWIDPDTTRIEMFGKRRQASRAIDNMFSDASGTMRQLRPETIDGVKPCLLEVADVLAYSAARAFTRQALKKKQRFQELFALFNASGTTPFVGEPPKVLAFDEHQFTVEPRPQIVIPQLRLREQPLKARDVQKAVCDVLHIPSSLGLPLRVRLRHR